MVDLVIWVDDAEKIYLEGSPVKRQVVARYHGSPLGPYRVSDMSECCTPAGHFGHFGPNQIGQEAGWDPGALICPVMNGWWDWDGSRVIRNGSNRLGEQFGPGNRRTGSNRRCKQIDPGNGC
jgi:hypothetical protein